MYDDDVVAHDFDIVVIKNSSSSVVTQLAYGEERMCELGKDVSLLGLLW